jgi:hypothetical protein
VEFAELRREVSALKAKVGTVPAPPAAPPTPTPVTVPAAPSAPAQPPAAPGRFDSLIVSDFPAIFAEFRGKQFKLLCPGSRDGFGASQFYGRCDGHANTLTVILDTDGNIFGGCTPVEWESLDDEYKADDSGKSFLFTLKNPHNITPRTFALIPAKKQRPIVCDSGCGPCFCDDTCVSDNCDANTRSYTDLGYGSTNDTGLDRETVFAGSKNFQVKEIEAFAITD